MVKMSSIVALCGNGSGGDTSFEDEPRSGRLQTVFDEVLRQVVEANVATSVLKRHAKTFRLSIRSDIYKNKSSIKVGIKNSTKF